MFEQKTAEWSEEDKKCLNAIEKLIMGSRHTGYNGVSRKDAVNWLKSLRPHTQWKPSESDIRILEQVIDGTANPINYHATLHAILEKLKKLKE